MNGMLLWHKYRAFSLKRVHLRTIISLLILIRKLLLSLGYLVYICTFKFPFIGYAPTAMALFTKRSAFINNKIQTHRNS